MSEYISTKEQLDDAMEWLLHSKILAIDTEFMREKSYFAKLCLIQVNNGQKQALIDPLACKNIHAFGLVLANKNIVKIFHAGTQDISILYHETGVCANPVFDTQLAASLLGHPLQIGYGPLVRSMCDVRLPKADGFTDWSRRPLSNNQLKYALDDVLYLPQIYDTMVVELKKSKRLSWLSDEFAQLADPKKYDVNPYEMWHRVKRISGLTRLQLAIVRELAAWREIEAQRRNIPRRWVLADEAVVEIARKAPNTVPALFEVRGLSTHFSHKAINQILEAVRKAKALPAEQMPKLTRHAQGNAQACGVVDVLAALVDLRAAQNDVASPVLASRDELQRLARGHRNDLPVLEGWRAKMVGNELIDVLEGRLALAIKSGELKTKSLCD